MRSTVLPGAPAVTTDLGCLVSCIMCCAKDVGPKNAVEPMPIPS